MSKPAKTYDEVRAAATKLCQHGHGSILKCCVCKRTIAIVFKDWRNPSDYSEWEYFQLMADDHQGAVCEDCYEDI